MTPRTTACFAHFAIGALAALWVAPRCAWAEPASARLVAIVTEVEGSARLVAHGRSLSPEVADPVEQGTVVALERDARIVLTYPVSGLMYELHGPGRFVVLSDSIQPSSASGRLERRELIPALRALQIRPDGATLQGSAAMRGASAAELQASGPSGTQFARDAIRICWRSLGPQWNYRVRLDDDDGTVLYEMQTPASTFEAPDSVELQPNAPYLWHLQATGPEGQVVDAAGQFRRLDPQVERALLSAESLAPQLDATGLALIRIAKLQQGISPTSAPGCALKASGSAASE
jgi:hypothetical protein